MSSTPIRLTPSDLQRYMKIRRRMLNEAPWAFAASPEDDRALDPKQLASLLTEPQNVVFVVEAPELGDANSAVQTLRELVAAAGIVRQRSPKFAHRARIWGVYVEPEYRGCGFGRAVIQAAIELARTWSGVDFIDLSVSDNAPEARRLYESLGFEVWGREPDATQHGGRRYDELHMTLRL